MKSLNIVELEHENGFLSVEIIHNDITKINKTIDLLVISSNTEYYYPTPGTVIGALKENLDIDIQLMSQQPHVDLRNALNCWSFELHAQAFKQILVVEINIEELIKNREFNLLFKKLFIAISVLQQMGKKIEVIALPVIGTGFINLDFELVIHAFLDELKTLLKTNRMFLKKILFVEFDKLKAEKLSDALDTILKRVNIQLPVDEVMTNVKNEILNIVRQKASNNFKSGDSYQFLKDTFNNKDSKSIVYGIACRRLIENLLTENYFSDDLENHLTFFNKINLLKEKDVANWIVSYLHVIRIFGNESAHDLSFDSRIPKTIVTKDISLLLFCVQRIMEFLLPDQPKDNN